MQEGWIKLHRRILETDIWQDKEPFDRRSAWVDLLMMASYTDRTVWIGATLVEVERGSLITSQEKLATRWQWSRKKVSNYLKNLEKLHMITVGIKNHRWTCINVVKYGLYQDSGTAEGTTEDTTEGTTEEPLRNHSGTTREPLGNTYKKVKKDKKENNKAARAHAREEQNFLDGVNAIDRRPALPGVNAIDPADNLSVNAIGSGEEKRDLAWAARLYEKKLGTFDGLVAEKIAALLEEVGPGVYERAVDRAQTNHAPRIGYVEAVARGLCRGDDFKRSQAKSGDIWGDAFKAYIGGDENGEDNQG